MFWSIKSRLALDEFAKARPTKARRRMGAGKFRPALEALEDRTLPSTSGLNTLGAGHILARSIEVQLGDSKGAASPSLTGQAGPAVVVGSGAKLTDAATIAGGRNPTGAITFTLYGPDESIVDTETVSTISGDGTYTTPDGYVPEAAGTFQWVISYSGDADNHAANTSTGDQPELVNLASPALVNTASAAGAVGGAALQDSADLTGGFQPTGTITFTLTGPDSAVVDTETVTVMGNGHYTTPTGFAPTQAGSYQWLASYSGDANNNSVSAATGGPTQTVTPADPTMVSSPTATHVTLGGTAVDLKDWARLTGGYQETGQLTFMLYFGNSWLHSEVVAVSGDGVYTTPNGFILPPSATPGTYQWFASYSGDANNVGVRDINHHKQQVIVTQALGTPLTVTITGSVYRDRTGNGFSLDDVPVAGVTVYLYKSLASVGTDHGYIGAAKTGADGTYRFGGLPAGTYYVREGTRSGYVQTGGGQNTSGKGSYYTVHARGGQTYGGNNFDDYLIPTGSATIDQYKVTTPTGMSTIVPDLRGYTQPGDTVTITFTIPTGSPSEQLTLVSYVAPLPTFTASSAAQQQIYDQATGTFAAGKTYTLSVVIPKGFYQIDFVHGTAISRLDPQGAGSDSGAITYHGQHRFISGDNGGTTPWTMPLVTAKDFGTIGFWDSAAGGQTLIGQLNGGGGSTALGNWLANNFQHLYGALAGTANSAEKNLAGLTNAQVAAFYQTLYQTNQVYAQIMASALSAYATATALAGSAAAQTFGLNTSTDGAGLDSYNLGTAAAEFGVNQNTPTVLTIIRAVDQLNSALFTAQVKQISNVFDGINKTGGIK